MAFIGNIDGPKESVVIEELGYKFFGISPKQFEDDIEDYRYSESRGLVVPVHVDENGRPFIYLSKEKKAVPFYLEGKYAISGDIQTHTQEELQRYLKYRSDL